MAKNPTDGLDFFPVEKKVKYVGVSTNEDIDKVIDAADSDTQDYLWTIRETMARVTPQTHVSLTGRHNIKEMAYAKTDIVSTDADHL